MKLKFKVQPYQTAAVDAVVECFTGQPRVDGISYTLDKGTARPAQGPEQSDLYQQTEPADDSGFKNADIQLSSETLLARIQKVQREQNLAVSKSLTDFTDDKGKPVKKSYKPGAPINLDVEMETGTGKTYCYVKTIFEMNRRYGWSKFIVMVPSIAIREGVQKTLSITADHFSQSYGKKARFFTYNSKRLHELESFSSDAGINVMVINIQAFNASGKDNRRIYDELDDFQSRRPIDVIAGNRPILILDEPQKMEGKATLEALPKFNPLIILRYSATHKTNHLKVHRLDAVDAYNQKLVKKIAVKGVQARGLSGTNAYLYLEGIDISPQAPVARLDMEVKIKSGDIKRQVKKVRFRDNLLELSGGLEQYKGFSVSQIDYNKDAIEFSNGLELVAGNASGDISEHDMRRIQIRETIRAHFDKEKQLYEQGVKVLSLFFIDEVAKYRDYSAEDEKGEYARIFEEEYDLLRKEVLSELPLDNHAYREYLERIAPDRTHNGYFSIDKKKRLIDPAVKKSGEMKGLSDDVDAYDLILKDKERLLSLEEDTRFIFSHSALREGWDNPNVFVMCMLKHSDNTISRRQEVGRGLRLAVDKTGERIDHPAIVHEVNVLTVIASESYNDFVAGLQKEIADTLTSRPKKADMDYFVGKVLRIDEVELEVSDNLARQIYRYLVKNDYTDDQDQISETYHEAKDKGELAKLPDDLQAYQASVFELIDSVFSSRNLPDTTDGRKIKSNNLNANFDKKAFKELWARINRKAVYRVDFDSAELIAKCIDYLNKELRVTPLQYVVQTGAQTNDLTASSLTAGKGFKVSETTTEQGHSVHSKVKYDLLGKISEEAELTRRTVAEILTGIYKATFDQFKQNPEQFISEASRLIKTQKAAVIIEKLSYNAVDDHYETDIFTKAQTGQDFSRATDLLQRHVYDRAVVDSQVEHDFVTQLDTSSEVVVYAKLPRGFTIPTPVGDYNPDWAISFKEGSVKHIYFVAETKGTLDSLKLRDLEQTKIDCAKKFFAELENHTQQDKVKYDVVDSYERLMDVVR
ncbi:type III restriction-modification system endonuclease [Gilvimarinus xylanilyticus]|uniref:DEAD/DEAH box helicase family protein n=1 Tax=Gilvimarinus xylanilyticus TaxID=2944139 RepID=A0A9X2HZA6_9GAMM|nr:DEAD/DEAH box helicase family protein [Gilvimarinus xylanilyticus]MCP8899266.1 DEAD/DEAH box helicase family protein [Gilvimarinus xylanilyticus]